MKLAPSNNTSDIEAADSLSLNITAVENAVRDPSQHYQPARLSPYTSNIINHTNSSNIFSVPIADGMSMNSSNFAAAAGKDFDMEISPELLANTHEISVGPSTIAEHTNSGERTASGAINNDNTTTTSSSSIGVHGNSNAVINAMLAGAGNMLGGATATTTNAAAGSASAGATSAGAVAAGSSAATGTRPPLLTRAISLNTSMESSRQTIAEIISQIRKYDPYPCILGIPVMPALFNWSKFYIFICFMLIGVRTMFACLRQL